MGLLNRLMPVFCSAQPHRPPTVTIVYTTVACRGSNDTVLLPLKILTLSMGRQVRLFHLRKSMRYNEDGVLVRGVNYPTGG
jgi:hypothetical protein